MVQVNIMILFEEDLLSPTASERLCQYFRRASECLCSDRCGNATFRPAAKRLRRRWKLQSNPCNGLFRYTGIPSACLQAFQKARSAIGFLFPLTELNYWYPCPAWHILFASLWKSFEGRFSGILSNLSRHKDMLIKEAVAIDIVEARKWRARASEELEKQEKARNQSTSMTRLHGWMFNKKIRMTNLTDS